MKNKLVYGIGICNKGKYKAVENGKDTKMYITWRGMLKRSYCPKYHAERPTYIGCTVDPQFHNFQRFCEWYTENYFEIPGERMHLDKDLLKQGNKVYGPSTCVFIPQSLNSLLNNNGASRGLYPQGVYFDKQHQKFRARVKFNSKNIHLGLFESASEAFDAYKVAKYRVIHDTLQQYKDTIPPHIFQQLEVALGNYEIK
jgi:hypothetical protein